MYSVEGYSLVRVCFAYRTDNILTTLMIYPDSDETIDSDVEAQLKRLDAEYLSTLKVSGKDPLKEVNGSLLMSGNKILITMTGSGRDASSDTLMEVACKAWDFRRTDGYGFKALLDGMDKSKHL